MDEEQIQLAIKLYQEDKISIWNIALKLNIEYNTLWKLLKERIKTRYSGQVLRVTTPEEEELIEKDYLSGVSLRKLSIKYNVDRTVINRIMREKNIKLRTIKESNKKKNIDEKHLIDLYLIQNKTCSEISKILNITVLTITRLLRKNNIEIRNTRKPNNKPSLWKFSPEIELEIINKYIKEDYSCGELGREYKTSHGVISRLLKKHNIKVIEGRLKSQKYQINENFFEKIDSPEHYLLMGILFTDGSVGRGYRVSLELQSQDCPTIEYLRNTISSTHPIYYNKVKNTNTIAINNKKMATDLKALGCIHNKTYSLKFPEWVENKFFSHLLNGAVIGDGWIYYSEDTFQVGLCGRKEFLEGFRIKIGEILNTNVVLHQDSDCKSNFSLVYNGYNALEICNFMFKDAPFIMKRKYLEYKRFVEENYAKIDTLRYNCDKKVVSDAIEIISKIESNPKFTYLLN